MDGNFSAEILLRETDLNRTGPEAGSPFIVVLRQATRALYQATIFLLETEGLSVISDIDDTIKITEVRDKARRWNTFLREFQPMPGMAEFYQKARPFERRGLPLHLREPVAALMNHWRRLLPVQRVSSGDVRVEGISLEEPDVLQPVRQPGEI